MILGVSALLKLMSPGYIGEELSRRLLGVLLGAAEMLFANAVPKALTRCFIVPTRYAGKRRSLQVGQIRAALVRRMVCVP